MTFDSHAVIPSILEKPGLDVEKDLMPVFLVGTAPYVVAANAERPYKTFADVIAACKANPGAVKYASVGIGTLGHLAMTVLGKKAGVEITHVPYRGGGPAMNDVLGGHVDLIIGSAALVTAQLGTNMLRPILQMGRERMPVLKDTQTAIEAGYPDFETLAWWGIFAPKDTPPDIIASMAKSVKEILSEPAVATQLQETQQMTLLLADGKDFRRSSPSRSASGARSCARTTSRRSGGTRHCRVRWPASPGHQSLRMNAAVPACRFAGLVHVARCWREGWRCRAHFGMKRSSTRLPQRVRGPVAQPDRATVS